MSESVAKHMGGSYPQKRYVDIVQPQKLDTRTATEIIEDVFTRAGIKVI